MACGGNSGKTVEQQAVEYREKAYKAGEEWEAKNAAKLEKLRLYFTGCCLR